MKRIAIALLLTLFCMQAWAQRDIKTFSKIGQDKIESILGTPDQVEEGMDDSVLMYYNDKKIVVTINLNSKLLESVICVNPDLCILSDYIEGGIKVGDPFSKVQGYDFVHSKYGRNKTTNGLIKLKDNEGWWCFDKTTNYVVYREEYQHIAFAVENGIIQGFVYSTYPDAPYMPYDFKNRLW